MRPRPQLVALSLCGLTLAGGVTAGQATAARRPAARKSTVRKPAVKKPATAKEAKTVKAAVPTLSYEHDVRPILKAYCIDCHGGEKVEGNLDLRLRRFIAKGGDSGPGLIPHQPAQSVLLLRVKAGDMPPVGKKVPAEQIAVIEKWIAAGAPTRRVEPEQLPPGMDITPEERAYWFFQPLRRPEPPKFKAADRVRTPIDAFVLQKLREKGLSFAPDADPLTLVRRAAFDLTGLPPSSEEVETYLKDCEAEKEAHLRIAATAAGEGSRSRSRSKSSGASPASPAICEICGSACPEPEPSKAYERMIDRLLASPHYGERWGRHWLDVAGYADSDGNGSNDTPRNYAYKYRDYVIRSLNADKPFDQFLTEQLAGDELVPRPWANLKPDQIEKLVATGFLRNAVDGTGNDPAATNQVVNDTLKIVSSSLLGLSVGCAQCHDHRYDPIPQSDYFRLRAIFEPSLNPARWRTPAQRLHSLYTDEERAKAAVVEAEAQKLQAAFNEKQARYVAEALEVELQKFEPTLREKLREALKTPADKRNAEQKQLIATNPKLLITPGVLYQYNQKAADELKADQAAIAAKRAQRPLEDFISILTEEPGQVPVTRLFYRGDYRAPKEAIAPGDLTIAAPEGARVDIPADDPSLPTTGRRLAWARHLTSGRHPLLSRVLVNRVWLNHFGRGIVDTPGEFGKLGTLPTHPELLDYLASVFATGARGQGPGAGETGSPSTAATSGSQGSSFILHPSSFRSGGPQPPTAGPAEGLGWSLKALHRLIMTSTVYRQASVADARKRAVDSDGSLYSRYPVRRLDAEALRDRMLAVAGRLDRTQFGPPVPLVEDTVGQVSAKDDSPRRSLYLQVRRSMPVSFLVSFDAPVMTVNCERRITTNSAPQALTLMNSDFVLKQAGHFAERLRKEAPGDLAKQVALAWEIAYNRPVTAEESAAALQFVRKQHDLLRGAVGAEKAEPAALTNLCQQLLSSNEFLYVD